MTASQLLTRVKKRDSPPAVLLLGTEAYERRVLRGEVQIQSPTEDMK